MMVPKPRGDNMPQAASHALFGNRRPSPIQIHLISETAARTLVVPAP